MDGHFGPRLTGIPIIIGFLALAAIVAMTFWLNVRTQTLFNEVTTARTIRAEAVDLRSALQAAESSQRGYLYTNNEVYLAPFDVAKVQGRKQMQLLSEGLSDTPSLHAARSKLSEVVEQKFAEMDESISLQQQQKDAEALSLVETNHGKALMDEANVHLSGIIRAADQRLFESVAEQQRNAANLRLVSILSALVIVCVVGIVAYFVTNYTRKLTAAQAAVTTLNADLEERVRQRTDDLANANEQLRAAGSRAEALLTEVNHRVANSLMIVSSLVKLQANSVTDRAAKNALAVTHDRIYAVSLVHKKLYTTGDVRVVFLNDYLGGLLEHIQTSIQNEQLGILITSSIAPVQMPTDLSINLGVILNEWVSNAVKYAYPDGKGEIRVVLQVIGEDKALLVVADDGAGPDIRGGAHGTGFGTKLVRAMATNLAGDIQYATGSPGTIARLTFPLKKFRNEPGQDSAAVHANAQL